MTRDAESAVFCSRRNQVDSDSPTASSCQCGGVGLPVSAVGRGSLTFVPGALLAKQNHLGTDRDAQTDRKLYNYT